MQVVKLKDGGVMAATFRYILVGGAVGAASIAFGIWPALVIGIAFFVVDQLIEEVSELHSELKRFRTEVTDGVDNLMVRHRLRQWLDDPQVTVSGLEELLQDYPSKPRP
jgi:hypothetical protein